MRGIPHGRIWKSHGDEVGQVTAHTNQSTFMGTARRMEGVGISQSKHRMENRALQKDGRH